MKKNESTEFVINNLGITMKKRTISSSLLPQQPPHANIDSGDQTCLILPRWRKKKGQVFAALGLGTAPACLSGGRVSGQDIWTGIAF